MKKILGLAISAFLIMGLVGGGTWAFFSDPESSTGNILTAGTLDLSLDGADAPVTTLDISNAAPGDSGSGSTVIKNDGNIDAELDIAFGSVTNTESSGSTEYEADGAPGELGGQATFAFFIDVDESGTWNTDDIGLKSDVTTYVNAGATSLDYQTLDSYNSNNWDDVYSGNMTASAQDNFTIMYQVPTSATNAIQGDSVSVDITFTLEQQAVD